MENTPRQEKKYKRPEISKEVFDKLHEAIVERMKAFASPKSGAAKFYGFGSDYRPFDGKNTTTPTVASEMAKDELVLSFVKQCGKSIEKIQFGSHLYGKKKKLEHRQKVSLGEDCYLAYFVFAFPAEIPIEEVNGRKIVKINEAIDHITNTFLKDKLNTKEIILSSKYIINFYIGLYYSAKAYEPKKIGFSLIFNEDQEGKTKILAEEWGFHKSWTVSPPKELILIEDNNIEEGISLENLELLIKEKEKKKTILVKGVDYSGPAEHVGNFLYCNLREVSGTGHQMNITCGVEEDLSMLKEQEVIRGLIQTRSAHTDDAGGIVAAEVIFIKVTPETVTELEVNISEIAEIDKDNPLARKYAELYLMIQRRLIRVKRAVIGDLTELRCKNIELKPYIELLPGLYRVWNLGFHSQVIQSRIFISNNYRAYLIPFFRNMHTTSYRAQWCAMNINTRYNRLFSLTSYIGLSATNHAIIDFGHPISENGKDNIYVGIYSSVGHKARITGIAGGVVGGYMLLRKENIGFRVREFFGKDDGKSSEEQRLAIGEKELNDYIKTHNLEHFKQVFDELLSKKYAPILNRLNRAFDNWDDK